ncbi:MAG: putative resolvase [Thermococcaceae archaeon]|jgi:putative resolvase|uniref:IS607 family transposase n=1 Tax=Thermococcus TaxID=2263 RepID=UPI0005B2C26B|nr:MULTISPECIES: IS607 family transposase [Thermococcus]KUJ98420.1 MAG: Excisionase [Thermococcales archaeon 44_46]MDK2854653.1 putative resolvase [Thermococcaceae archaeon]MCA6213645.1 IS607 family transposase [Thermococcus bergensis]MDK2984125.1 putative resolvase [Thermococcaceae archaeon]MDN5321190.1 putative resolvase [Thermococcaceae archaeon]
MERHYTLKEASKILGVTVKTLQNWDKQGKIRVVRTVGGRRRIPESEIKRILGIQEERKIIGYARVSSRTQKDDLNRQVQTIKEFAKEKGWDIEILKDIGSGLNEKRKNYQKLLKMVTNKEVSKVIITYSDRLTRFGFETLKTLFQAFGTEIIVINGELQKEPREELIEDLIAIISHFAGKLYGMRSRKYEEVVENAKQLFQE